MVKVLGIKIIDRIKEAGLTQGILSRYPGIITTRLGFHEVTDNVCSREACIILHLKGDDTEIEMLKDELGTLGGVIIREMVFPGIKENPSEEQNGQDPASIIGILAEKVPDVINPVQKLLTSFGCNIRTRLGINDTFSGEPAGLIILELIGDPGQRLQLEKHLMALRQVHVSKIVF